MHNGAKLLKYIEDIDPEYTKKHLDSLNGHGYTPLMMECRLGHVDDSLYLIAKGADVTIEADGLTALDLAKRFPHPDMQEVVDVITSKITA